MVGDKLKTLGQVWTPPGVVEIILDKVGFMGEGTLTTKILEPSFGAGVFLKAIIARMVAAGREQGKTSHEIAQLIDTNLYAVEYDVEIFNQTKTILTGWAEAEHNITLTLPNLIQGDALLFHKPGFFDFVVGNPPYVRVHNLPASVREKVNQYSTATGTTDLYIIFYELGLTWLNSEGMLGFIAPNSWLRNVSQKNMRKSFLKNRFIKEIIDYGQVKIFPEVNTYTNISILDKKGNDTFVYTEMLTMDKPDFTVVKNVKQVNSDKPFVFLSEKDTLFIEQHQTLNNAGVFLSTVGKVQNGLATLGDKMFLVDETMFKGSDFVLPTVKASTFKGDLTQAPLMFFPYTNTNGNKYEGISEGTFEETSPDLYKHFLTKKPMLEKRATDKGSLWFWYGRSQAIQETGKPKLVISPIVHPDIPVKVFIIPENVLVYSGLFITALDGKKETLERIKKHLETPEFLRFACLLGKNMSGGYKNISAPIVKSFVLKK